MRVLGEKIEDIPIKRVIILLILKINLVFKSSANKNRENLLIINEIAGLMLKNVPINKNNNF